METLTATQIDSFIVENHTTQTMHEMADVLNIPMPNVRAKYNWLVRKNVIEKPQTTNENIIEVDSDLNDFSIMEDISKLAKEKLHIKFITENYKYLTIPEMANKLGIKHQKVTGLLIKANVDRRHLAKSEESLKYLVGVHNTYTNNCGTKKEVARKLLVKEIIKSKLVGGVLTLPFYTALFEQKLHSLNNLMYFVGVEQEKNTYLLREKYNRLNDFPMVMHNCDLAEIIEGSGQNTFAHAFLDYTGGLQKFGGQIIKAMDKGIVKVGGILAFTVENAQRYQAEEINKMRYADMGFKREIDSRTDSSLIIDRFICEVKGHDYELVKNHYYKDDSRVGMNLVILKRIK